MYRVVAHVSFMFFILLLVFSCQVKSSVEETKKYEPDPAPVVSRELPEVEKKLNYDTLPDSAFVELIALDSSFVLDVRYATPNNFMKRAVYPCAKVLLRKIVADSLISAQKAFQKLGYSLKIFDGYRPLSVQWELWRTVPQKGYVANPKYGSKHNRGMAVDVTLVDKETLVPLEMGTDYDFFGKKAHHTYTALPTETIENRKLLKETLAKYGFSSIRTEWWHYNFREKFRVSDHPLPCP